MCKLPEENVLNYAVAKAIIMQLLKVLSICDYGGRKNESHMINYSQCCMFNYHQSPQGTHNYIMNVDYRCTRSFAPSLNSLVQHSFFYITVPLNTFIEHLLNNVFEHLLMNIFEHPSKTR